MSDTDEDEQSLHENSFQSRFSDNGNEDESINSNAEFDAESNRTLRLVGQAMFGGAFLW